MLELQALVFRYLTDADFFNINKPPGTEARGGGQSYIDFSTQDVPVSNWDQFFRGVIGVKRSQAAQGPRWNVPVRSIGRPRPEQFVSIYQRRQASVIIAAQKLDTRRSNRIQAWHPSEGFPKPIDREQRQQCPPGLVVYLARSSDGTIWAGWFLNDGISPSPFVSPEVERELAALLRVPVDLDPRAGMIFVGTRTVWLDEASPTTPFRTLRPVVLPHAISPEIDDVETDQAIDSLFEEDLARNSGRNVSYSVARVRRRNVRASKALKELYKHTCQITGEEYLFRKRDGTYYTEVHHLVPLGAGGADDPRNMVVLSPQMHKMFHYAVVGPIDLSGIREGADGRWYLDVMMNGRQYRIHWDSKHAKIILG